MKMFIFFILILAFTFSCSDENSTNPFEANKMRETAYSSLTEMERESLTINWNEAPVVLGNFKSASCKNSFYSDKTQFLCFGLSDSTITLREGQILSAVIFYTTNDPLLGPLIVVIDPDKNMVVGQSLRF